MARAKVSYKWVLPCAGFVVSFFGKISALISSSKHLRHGQLDHNCKHNKTLLLVSLPDFFVLLPIEKNSGICCLMNVSHHKRLDTKFRSFRFQTGHFPFSRSMIDTSKSCPFHFQVPLLYTVMRRP